VIAVDVLVGILLLAGLVGSLVPVVPGTALILLAAVLYAAATGFDPVGPGRLLLLAVLTGLAYALDYVAGALGTRRFGGTGWAVGGALLGAVVGVFFGPLGLVLGPVIGAVAGELVRSRRLPDSLRSGLGTVVGMMAGVAVKLSLGFVMVALFLLWVLRG
jgi:uncharacterized protein